MSPNVEVRTVGEGDRRMFARAPIAKGEVLLRIPAACHVAADWPGICADEAREAAALPDGAAKQTFLLIARLLRERAHTGAPAGAFAAYYGTLPRTVDTPLAWPAEQLLGLAEHHRALFALRRKRALLSSRHAAIQRCRGLEHVGWGDLLWAEGIVTSRAFGFGDGGQRQLRFVPIADMANHHPTHGGGVDYSVDDEEFVMTCTRDYAADEEIFVTYGVLSNDKLLEKYGFALEVNEEHNGYCSDEVTIILPAPRDNPFKLQLINAAGIQTTSGVVQLSTTYLRKVPELLSVIRLLAADDEDVALIRAKRPAITSVHDLTSLSLKNESEAWCLLWRYACGRCTGFRPPDDYRSTLQAYARAVEAVRARLLSGPGPPDLAEPPGEPVIAAITREALRACGGAPEARPEDDERVRSLAAECGAAPRGPGAEGADLGAEAARRRAAFVRFVVASDRRVFAHFAALATVSPAVVGLPEDVRGGVLPRLEAAAPLAGLAAASRMLVARYARGICRFLAASREKGSGS